MSDRKPVTVLLAKAKASFSRQGLKLGDLLRGEVDARLACPVQQILLVAKTRRCLGREANAGALRFLHGDEVLAIHQNFGVSLGGLVDLFLRRPPRLGDVIQRLARPTLSKRSSHRAEIVAVQFLCAALPRRSA
jgi:hypothetical protein